MTGSRRESVANEKNTHTHTHTHTLSHTHRHTHTHTHCHAQEYAEEDYPELEDEINYEVRNATHGIDMCTNRTTEICSDT